MVVTRKRTTVLLNTTLVRALKALATSTGRPEDEIVEEALRQYLISPETKTSRDAMRDLLGRLGGQQPLNDDKALDLAYAELHASRRQPY